METLTLTPQAPLRPAGGVPESETRTSDAATDFAALLAQELEMPADPVALAADEAALAAAETGQATAEDPALALNAAPLPVDALAALQLPAMPLAPLPPAQAAVAAPAAAVAAAGGAQAEPPAEIPGAAAAAKNAVAGNASPALAAAARDSRDAALPEPAAAMATPAAPPLPEHLAHAWSSGAMAQQSHVTGAAAAVPRVAVPVSQPGWSEAFAQRVVWMAGQQQSTAELHLNPPELGPVSIMLSLDNDQASVFFSSPHIPVREAIENALPNLREALGQAGIQLGETGVSAESFRRDAGGQEQQGRGPAGTPAEIEPALLQGAPRTLAGGRPGLVDTFA